MIPQPRPAILIGSTLVIAACVPLASFGIVALFASALLIKLLGGALVVLPGMVSVFQYCGTFRQSHDAALLAATCLALLIVPTFLLSVAVLIAGATDPSARAVLLATGAQLLGLAVGGGWMMIANLHWASILEEAAADAQQGSPSNLKVAAEAVGFALIVAATGTVAATISRSSVAEGLLSAF